MGIEFHHITNCVSVLTFGRRPYGVRAAAKADVPVAVDAIAEQVPAVADALAKLHQARAAMQSIVDAMAALVSEHEDYTVKVKAGKVQPKADTYWQGRADDIRDAHTAALRVAVAAQDALLDVSAPHVEAARQRDRDEIGRMTDRLAVLIDRSTGYAPHSGVVDGFLSLGNVDNILRALRVIAAGGAR
ncbi:hypothetical protein [Micromonospora ureilytica]|uniref:Uncharacterized protein n=1 Tax=Micromonospora ureilytica TaxID=709868 RepID=A0ABS0JLC6_9ACTN|nr:hypothetical protein [Micromonospora ureilytica]MBG6067858.1 hypothetical protein [Micromonospora ureilytica]